MIIIQLSLKSSQVFKLRVLCWSPRRKNGKTATIFKVMEATIYAEGCYTIHVNSFKNFLSSIGELGLFEQQRLKDKAQNYSRCEILLFFFHHSFYLANRRAMCLYMNCIYRRPGPCGASVLHLQSNIYN